jgi:hypothetical protein
MFGKVLFLRSGLGQTLGCGWRPAEYWNVEPIDAQ